MARFSTIMGLLLAMLAAPVTSWADVKSFEEILRKQLPLQEDLTGRGAKLVRAMEQHQQKKPGIWAQDLQRLKGLKPLELLQEVQDLVNRRIRYLDDPFNEWQAPFLAYHEGGDCEDYAIAKLLLLREAGFAEEGLRVVSLAPVRLNSPYHVVLVAQLDSRIYVLDSPNRAQSREVVLLENYLEADRPVMWAGWSGGFAFSSTTLGKQSPAFAGLLLPRRSRILQMVSGEDRLLLVAADLKVITRRERPLNPAEIAKLRNLRAYYHDPIPENARRIPVADARKLDSFRRLRH